MAKTSRLRHLRHNRLRGGRRGFDTRTPAAAVDTTKRRLDVTWDFFVRIAAKFGAEANTAVTFVAGTDIFTHTGHGLRTGYPIILGGTAVPTGFGPGFPYSAIVIDANTYRLAESYDNAVAGIFVNGTDAGTAVTATRGAASFALNSYLRAGVKPEQLNAAATADAI